MSEFLKKDEIINSKRIISQLFTEGEYLSSETISIIHLPLSSQEDKGTQLIVTIPKKKIRKATKRNLLKRRIKEAYRRNKPRISMENHSLALAIVYKKTFVQTYSAIEMEVVSLMDALTKRYMK